MLHDRAGAASSQSGAPSTGPTELTDVTGAPDPDPMNSMNWCFYWN